MRAFRRVIFLIAVGLLGFRAHAALVVPAYNSFTARTPKTILYLDFIGDNNTPDFGPYHPGQTPAYDIDGDPTTFSAQEQSNIFQIWEGVGEKYSPFKVNVTTVDPGNTTNSVRMVIGGDGSWAPNAPNGTRPGGISITGAYAIGGSNFPRLGFVFPANLGNGNARYVAEAAAHEGGHIFGLSHQALYNANGQLVTEYNPGNAQRAPIMGQSYFAQRGTWALGPTPDDSSPTAQDDLAIISQTGVHTNNFGYRADDHPSLPTDTGDPLTIAPDMTLSGGAGVIEQTTDADFFQFDEPFAVGVNPVPAHIVADVAPFAPMLDLTLKLYDSSGNLMATSSTPSLGESIDALLTPGQTYKVGVFSAGNYGDLGQYSISGFVPEPASAAALLVFPISFLVRRRWRGM